MGFIPIKMILDGQFVNKKVAVRGWVYRKREGKQMIFLIMRDSTGVIQCPVKKESPAWSEAEKVTIESSLVLEGTVKKDPRAPGGYEIVTENVSIIGLAELFPITKDKSFCGMCGTFGSAAVE
jgi:asparaginyl-tRNA synthetase